MKAKTKKGKEKEKKKSLQIHHVEKKILGLLDSDTLVPLSSVRLVVGRGYKRTLGVMKKKKIVLEKIGKTEPVYTLAPYGEILKSYFFPFPVVWNELERTYTTDPTAKSWARLYTTALVLPETAAQETGFSLTSIRNKIIGFHYLVIARRLYILKRIRTRDLPHFPVVDSRELSLVFPKIPCTIREKIQSQSHQTEHSKIVLWNWPELLQFLLKHGRRFPEEEQEQKQDKDREGWIGKSVFS